MDNIDNVDNLKIKLKHLEINDKEKLIRELKNFIEYNLKNNKIDNKFVYELLELLVDCRNLFNYIDELISFDYNYMFALGYGAYFPNSATLEIYLWNIYKKFHKKYGHYNPYIRKLLYVFQIFDVCFHEIEHANQIKTCRENNSNLETLILRNSMKYLPNKEFEMLLINKGYNAFEVPDLIEIKDNLEYDLNDYYNINPSERLANVKSAFIAICSLVNYFEECPILEQTAYFNLYDSLYSGYKSYKNPTEIFIKKYDKINDLELIKTKTESLTILEKAAYGIRLNNKEKKLIRERREYYNQK